MLCAIGYSAAMLNLDALLGLSAFAFVSSITPGPNNLMLMASGTNFGFARTLPHLAGVVLGFGLMIVLMALGLHQVFEAVPLAYPTLKIISVLYLLYLAWKIATAAPPATDAKSALSKPLSFVQATLFQWVNPKAWAMGLAAIAGYTLTRDPVWNVALLTLVFVLINLPCVSAWTLMGVSLRRLLENPRWLRVFNVTAALLLVASIYPMLSAH